MGGRRCQARLTRPAERSHEARQRSRQHHRSHNEGGLHEDSPLLGCHSTISYVNRHAKIPLANPPEFPAGGTPVRIPLYSKTV